MKTILVAYDDTASGKVALQRAVEMTARLDAELIVITVAPVVNLGRAGGRTDPYDSPARRDEVLAEARAYLTEHGVDARYLRITGPPADAIVHAAKEYGVDLIIVGRRSTNLLKRLLGQSVSEAVLHKAPCTVLIARVPDQASERPAEIEQAFEPVRERLAA
jgi:nucleotide-binding universal stress UspA family protein